jgi:sugar/nucleoside kinase (ribokinase family)
MSDVGYRISLGSGHPHSCPLYPDKPPGRGGYDGFVILVFGTICIDRVRRVPSMPSVGGYVEIASEEFLLGGEAANTACALQAWGADYLLAGNGFNDPLLTRELEARGIRPATAHILPSSHAPVCDVYVDDDGERTMIGKGFSAMKNTIDPSLLPFRAGEWFTAEPNMGEAARRAAVLAHESGMKTFLMDFVGIDVPVFPGSYWQSSTDWAGSRGDLDANLRWVGDWVNRFGCFAILTDGTHGFVAGAPGTSPRHYPNFPLDSFVDATGAGDTFRAGMLFGLDHDWPASRCLRFASAAGCLACRSLGATTAIPSVGEIEALIAANPSVSAAYD